jgi:predicted nucleic acid-binding protein
LLIYLDTNVVIYLIEQTPGWGPRASARIAVMRANQDRMALSDLVRMECRVGPLRSADAALLARYDGFFSVSGVQIVGLTAAVCDLAATIRAAHGFRTPDALNLAAAVESGCGAFLTNDMRLARFPGLTVEVLT